MTRFESIGPERAEEALDFCRSQPAQSVFLAGWIADGGLRGHPVVPRGWIMAERARDSRIVGLCYLSATGILISGWSMSMICWNRSSGLDPVSPSGRSWIIS